MDHKRVHYLHTMYHGTTGAIVARNECLCMNVHLETRRSSPFPASVREKLDSVFAAHQQLERPDSFGRTLHIRR